MDATNFGTVNCCCTARTGTACPLTFAAVAIVTQHVQCAGLRSFAMPEYDVNAEERMLTMTEGALTPLTVS
eukprot:3805450-Amphidinium_carterae.1